MNEYVRSGGVMILIGQPKFSEKNLSQRQSVEHKSYINWSGIVSRLQYRQAGD
jgi:hypothetical protein